MDDRINRNKLVNFRVSEEEFAQITQAAYASSSRIIHRQSVWLTIAGAEVDHSDYVHQRNPVGNAKHSIVLGC